MKYVVTIICDDGYTTVYEFTAVKKSHNIEVWDFIQSAMQTAREPITVCVKILKGAE